MNTDKTVSRYLCSSVAILSLGGHAGIDGRLHRGAKNNWRRGNWRGWRAAAACWWCCAAGTPRPGDYRLIRRPLLERIHLTSTSGTICVELVRKLEMTGCGVVETGVRHYPRLYGKSRFFRVRSLATTFYELARLWVRVVILRRTAY